MYKKIKRRVLSITCGSLTFYASAFKAQTVLSFETLSPSSALKFWLHKQHTDRLRQAVMQGHSKMNHQCSAFDLFWTLWSMHSILSITDKWANVNYSCMKKCLSLSRQQTDEIESRKTTES